MRAVSKKPHARGGSRFRYSDEKLHTLWSRLHHGDREPWPEAEGVQEAWREFHAGQFEKAIKLGAGLGALGASAANKAAAIATLYERRTGHESLRLLEEAAARGESAVGELPDYPNAHYMLALVLGRYSQQISILKAVAQGLASRVRSHLERTLALEPKHAEAHVALGLYHAELIAKLGTLAASITYGASSDRALEHFERALKLAPASPIVHIEYANGLMLLNAGRNRAKAEELYAKAAACEPLDAMEELDVARARRGVD